MRLRFLVLSASFFLPVVLVAQSKESVPFEIFGAYSYFTNMFNGVPGSRSPLDGWDAAVAFPAWHNLRFKIDVSGYSGKNLGAQQNVCFIMAGGQYERSLWRERLFAEALFGDGGLNRDWGANGSPGSTASISTLLGGGVDTPLSRHIGIRVEGIFSPRISR
jgi:hypothetical protein